MTRLVSMFGPKLMRLAHSIIRFSYVALFPIEKIENNSRALPFGS